jgi:hypothetical protein
MFTFSTYRRCLAIGALVLACCAMLAPAASAMIPDRHQGTSQEGPGGAIAPGDVGYYTHDVGATASDAGIVTESVPVRPDDRATHGIGGQLNPGDVGYDTHDVGATTSDAALIADGTLSRPAPADGVAATAGTPVVPAAEPVSGTGFDWSDAGVGIVLGVLCAMLLGGLVLFSRRRGTVSGA